MAVQTLTLAGRLFVIMPESEYRKLKPKVVTPKKALNGRARKMTKQDLGDLAEHRRRMAEPGGVALEDVRRRLGNR
jgi:hypothetical protein